MPKGNNRNGGNDNKRHFELQDWMIIVGIGAFILVLVILLA